MPKRNDDDILSDRERIVHIIQEFSGSPVSQIVGSSNLFKDGIIDSMSVVQILLAVEKEASGSLQGIELAAYDWSRIDDFVRLFLNLRSPAVAQ